MNEPTIHYGRYQGRLVAEIVEYDSHWLLEKYSSMADADDAAVVWEAIQATKPETYLAWCKRCGHTKHHDANGFCMGCESNLTTLEDYDDSFPARH